MDSKILLTINLHKDTTYNLVFSDNDQRQDYDYKPEAKTQSTLNREAESSTFAVDKVTVSERKTTKMCVNLRRYPGRQNGERKEGRLSEEAVWSQPGQDRPRQPHL